MTQHEIECLVRAEEKSARIVTLMRKVDFSRTKQELFTELREIHKLIRIGLGKAP